MEIVGFDRPNSDKCRLIGRWSRMISAQRHRSVESVSEVTSYLIMGLEVAPIDPALNIATSSKAVFDMYPNTGNALGLVSMGVSRSIEGDF